MGSILVGNPKHLYEIAELVKLFPGGNRYEVRAAEQPAGEDLWVMPSLEKNEAKRLVYDFMHSRSGYTPPWGTLTGVRPAKLADELLLRMSEEEAAEKLAGTYLITPEKISLLMEVCRNQKHFERAAAQSGLTNGKAGSAEPEQVSLYVGVPFCPTRCAYCSFPASAREEKTVAAYLEALFREIEAVGALMKDHALAAETVYVGGGTPTALTADELSGLLGHMRRHLRMDDAREFTVEAGRPDTVTAEKLAVIKAHGAGRISVNPQTMKQETLDLIGRKHTAQQTRQAALLAAGSGASVVNMDLIAGLPGESLSDFRASLRDVLAFHPQNITVHTLAIKKSSRLKERPPDTDPKDVYEMVKLSREELQKAGYGAYYLYRQKYMSGNFENVGYALPGTENGYNIRIMSEKQTIIAMGAGAISKFYFPRENRLERVANVSDTGVYIRRIDEMIRRKVDFFAGR